MRVHFQSGPPVRGVRGDVPGFAVGAVAVVDELCGRASVVVEGDVVQVVVPSVRWTLREGVRVRESVSGEVVEVVDDVAFASAFAADMASAGLMYYLHAGGAVMVPDSGVDWVRSHCAVLDEFYGPCEVVPEQQPQPVPEQQQQQPVGGAYAAAQAIYDALPADGARRTRDRLRNTLPAGLWHHFDDGVAVLRASGAVEVSRAASGAAYARVGVEEPPAGNES